MAANTAGTPDESGSSGGGLGGKIVVILSVLNILVTGGVLAVLFRSFEQEKAKPSIHDLSAEGDAHHEGEEGHEGAGGHAAGGSNSIVPAKKKTSYGKMVTLEQFTVNLSTPASAGAKFARVNISLEVLTDDTESEINLKIPQVRNAIIDIFNSKRPSDLATTEGREYVKEEIQNALNGFLTSGKVKGVYFTSFALAG